MTLRTFSIVYTRTDWTPGTVEGNYIVEPYCGTVAGAKCHGKLRHGIPAEFEYLGVRDDNRWY